jgi:1-acyl-sn-glycerol-3-phosphate acyltransferase
VRAGVPVVPVALEGTHKLMKKGAIDTGDGTMRHVHIKIGAPIHAKPDGREGPRVNDLRERTHAAVKEMLLSMGGAVADEKDEAPAPPRSQASAESE